MNYRHTQRILIALGILCLAGILFGTAWAEELNYTGDSIPLRIVVSQGDVLYFTGTDKIPNMNVIYPNSINTPCSNSEATGKCVIDFSNFPLGQHEWKSTSGVNGKFQVSAPVVALDDSYENVSQQAKDFKAAIEAKMEAKLAPYKAEIKALKLEISNSNEREGLMQNQIATLKVDLSKSVEDATDAQAQTAQLTEANATIEQYKKDASNWKAVALEQLRVMVDVLGLF
jgi:hypothetical protein